MTAAHGAFDLFVGIDYSGAGTPDTPLPGLRAFAAVPGGPVLPWLPDAQGGRVRNWTRRGLAHRLEAAIAAGQRLLVGIDHNFSFPESYFRRYGLTDWNAFLHDFRRSWPTHLEGCTVQAVRDGSWWQARPPAPPARTGASSEWRLCERWTSSAKSVFHFDAQGAVAKSSHAGLPWLLHLRERLGARVHLWPFDGWVPVPGTSLLCEVYPSVLRHRYPRDGRGADEQDAFAVAAWLQQITRRQVLDRYLSPPLDAGEQRIGALEGWILGIG